MYLSSMLRAGQVLANSIWNIDAGVQKKVMKNKGSIRLSARDIFHTFLQDGEYINIPNTTVAYRNYMDTQVITVNFTYNFGSMKNKQRKRDAGGAESEKDRVRN
jgi:DNA-directed RNA polymerase delta subunit